MQNVFLPRFTRAVVACVVGGAAALGLAGCTGSDDEDAGQPTAGPAGIDRVEQGFPAPPSELAEGDTAKADDVVIGTCDVLGVGGMRAQGTVTNTTEDKQRYQILVYFVAEDGSETVAHNWASTVVSVPAGESVPFVAERAFDTAGATLSCQVQAVN